MFLKDIFAGLDWQAEDEGEFLGNITSEISAVKGDHVALSNYYPQSCPQEVFVKIYEGYEKRLREESLIDFDDMMKLCYELFSERKDILSAWQQKYRYILIDEFQDINRLQYDIIRMLAKPEDNLFVVGDDDQSIYRFRGARPEIMLGFPKDYPGCEQILLDVNYRSAPAVVESAGRLIRQNNTRFAKKLRSAQTGEEPVRVRSFAGLTEENDAVIRMLAGYHRQGIPYEDMALLYRTNSGPRVMAGELMRANLPFCMTDVIPNLYEHWICGDLLTYMLIAAGSRRRGDFLRIINRPRRYIPRSAFPDPEVSLADLRRRMGGRDWMEERVDRLAYDLRMLSQMAPYAAVNYIRKGIGYEDFLKEYAESRHINLEELMGLLDELQESAAPFATLSEWMAHMEEYTRALKEQKASDRKAQSGIAVTTMHSSKGLEYRVVFVMDANEGITPHRKAVLDADVEEERRLFYVAMTRAKTYLHLCYVRERFNRELLPSRFVRETGIAAEVWQPDASGSGDGRTRKNKKRM